MQLDLLEEESEAPNAIKQLEREIIKQNRKSSQPLKFLTFMIFREHAHFVRCKSYVKVACSENFTEHVATSGLVERFLWPMLIEFGESF